MSKKTYEFVEDSFFLSRRKFMAVGAAFMAALALPIGWIASRIQSRNDYINARTAGLYKDDAIAALRVSHANPAVAKYYEEFGGKPLGHTSHELLHTHFIDRTKLKG
ncbi:iron hydrogenase small subunit [Ferrimonas balearica DSM 9799]|uniref:Iron hydrogenase small subunit n=1 Tax=Ferrimonas balearica (strain DSM 9799 / CCM 4581 / KCTC 23876 / PAT) TaxID=550540 RepID=E1SUC4_FERBD|nr:iron hydrogenase small subunit [Ferrimonas balearica]MBY6016740.1 iron hydrogenase small subunit [Halomonas denitrificans]ADN76257.1 iron hydrogenase small subunit [Ferrimonas balearica DSM 9799]MBW3139164.1 iron hydrogenase small subunit [Ferrimonas balearica]MBW3163243.1 iron hydrogenase small subunit [Ferrimonas balearica]MBY5980939.1 iron hydrogenase small subunit [Ferrimonas balearica]